MTGVQVWGRPPTGHTDNVEENGSPVLVGHASCGGVRSARRGHVLLQPGHDGFPGRGFSTNPPDL